MLSINDINVALQNYIPTGDVKIFSCDYSCPDVSSGCLCMARTTPRDLAMPPNEFIVHALYSCLEDVQEDNILTTEILPLKEGSIIGSDDYKELYNANKYTGSYHHLSGIKYAQRIASASGDHEIIFGIDELGMFVILKCLR